MKRASISACLGICLVWCAAGEAQGQGKTYPRPRRTAAADHSPLPYDVHITPTTMAAGSTSIEVGSDSWSARGYDLKSLIAQVYDIDVRRIDFGDEGLADARFDLNLSVPVDLDADAMQQVLADAIQKRFGLTITPQSRPMDVYVLTAPNGAGSALRPHEFAKPSAKKNAADDGEDSGAGRITYFGSDCTHTSESGIDVEGGTIADFRQTLEPDLDRVLLDETHLKGSYDFKVGNYASQQQLFQVLRDQLGLLVTPEERNVIVLEVRPAGAKNTLQATL